MLIESEVRELASPGPVYCRVSMSPEGASITLITEPADSSIDQRGWVSRLFGRFYIISPNLGEYRLQGAWAVF